MNPTGLVKVIHISDVHFTRNDPSIRNDHIFDPPVTPAGDQPGRAGWPEVWQMIEKDLAGEDPGFPVILCISGDLAHTAHVDEYDRAKQLVRRLAKIPVFGKARGLGNIFLVPGNHDVLYDVLDEHVRSSNFIKFYNDVLQTDLDPGDPYSVVQIHDRIDDLGILLLCLHSAVWVRKGVPDQDRGEFDPLQFRKVKTALEQVPAERLQAAIRIAMIHHHPVLIPPLVERGYDAVLHSGELLNLLRDFGFHIVLHGHKHYPYNFTYDARSPFHAPEPTDFGDSGRLTIVGGGSIGSRSIPDLGLKCNCYNRITIRWNPAVDHFRARIETRRLRTRDDKNNPLLPVEWTWDSLYEDDRSYSRSRFPDAELPSVRKVSLAPFRKVVPAADEQHRIAEYERTRGNQPVVEIRPSLEQDQDRYFEARVWIVPHGKRELPRRVVWSAGPKFDNVVVVSADDDLNFCASFYYHGGMLLQGRLEFAEGEALVHVYARVPLTYE